MEDTEWFEGHSELTPRRMVILPWLIWAITIGITIGGAFYVSRVEASDDPRVEERKAETLITRNGNDYVRIAAPPCPGLPSWRTGDALLEGKRYKLCWKAMEVPQPHIRIVFEDGDIWTLPPRAFQPESQNPPGI